MSTSNNRLQTLRDMASGAVAQAHAGDDLVERYEEANALVRELGDGNVRDWVSEQYRSHYQDWLAGDADPPCRCSNPGCPLKNGRLPYEIRRDDSLFSIRDTPAIEDRIKSFLDDHPEAVVLSDALEDLEGKKHRAESIFEEVIRAEARIEVDNSGRPTETGDS